MTGKGLPKDRFPAVRDFHNLLKKLHKT